MFRHDFGRCPLDNSVLAPLERDVLVGAALGDRYVIERCVGEGGMGRVYRARHRNLDRLFAVKVLYGDLAASSKMRLRFEREARAASRVDHPHLVSVLDSGITDRGLLYLVMTYVEGRELGAIIEDEAPFAPERVHRLVRQLCQGLAHAHDQGLVHRDFKGQNVLVSGTGEDEHARILDFGLAFMREEPDSSRLTTEGVVMGTPAFMSPEQATGSELDHRTDLFSLGVLIYEMLAGTLPFDGTPVELARQNLAAAAPLIAERVPGLVVDPGLEGIAHRLMHKLPADRFQSAHEVMAALDMVAAGDQDTHSVPALHQVSAAGRSGPVSAGGRSGVRKAAAGDVDVAAATQSMEQKPAAATLVAPAVPPVAQGAPARAEQAADRRRLAVVATERVHPSQHRQRVAAAVVALALVAAVVIALLVRSRARDAERATATPGNAAPAPAEVAAPAPAEVAAPAPAEAMAPGPPEVADPAPAPAIVAVPAPDAAPAAVPAVPEPRSRESRRSRRAQNTAEPVTKPAGPVADPSAGAEKPDAASDLEALYKRVGRKLAAFEREHGATAARPLWDVYSDIPLLDAMRTPSLGQDATRTLRRLERDMAAARPAP